MVHRRTKDPYEVILENLPDPEVLGRLLAKMWAETVYTSQINKQNDALTPQKHEKFATKKKKRR